MRTLQEGDLMTDSTDPTSAVTGGLRTLLRLEGLALFAGPISYASGPFGVSFAGYLAGPRAGAIIYNAAHNYMGPMAMMTAGFALSQPLVLSIAMIWLAHIGIDRALGYGLKYSAGFGFTHLGRIGRGRI